MSHILCSNCNARVAVYDLPSHTKQCGGYVAGRLNEASTSDSRPSVSSSLSKMLQRVAPHARLPSAPSLLDSSAEIHQTRSPRSPVAARSPAASKRTIHESPASRFFNCPRCLLRVESAELSRHLGQCIRQHLKDRGLGPSPAPLIEDTPAATSTTPPPAALITAHTPSAVNVFMTSTPQPEVAAPPGLKVCPLCVKMVDASSFVMHLDLCPENKKSCEYCYEGVPLTHWDNHARSCPRHRQACYVCGTMVQFAKLADHMATCSPANRVLVMYHGTDLDSARSIMREGFRPSEKGLLGVGVYLSKDITKAQNYGPVILEARVDVGRVCVIDRANHPHQRNWHAQGFDSAWIPPGSTASKSRLEEHCVFDPRRIAVLGQK